MDSEHNMLPGAGSYRLVPARMCNAFLENHQRQSSHNEAKLTSKKGNQQPTFP